MSTYEKKGHPVLGIVLGILGLLIGVMLPLLCGIIGGGIAAVLGLVALLLGIQARKSGAGITSIVIGALAIILAVSMTITSVGTMKVLKEKAVESGIAPTIAQYADNPYLGILGVVMKMPQTEDGVKKITDEFDALNKLLDAEKNAK